MRGLSARDIMARLKVSMWQLPAIVSDMRKRKLAAAGRDAAVRRHPGDAGRPAAPRHPELAIVSSDSEASVRLVLGPTASLITRFDCGAAVFGKHWKFQARGTKARGEADGDHLHRRRTPRHRRRRCTAGMRYTAPWPGRLRASRGAAGGRDPRISSMRSMRSRSGWPQLKARIRNAPTTPAGCTCRAPSPAAPSRYGRARASRPCAGRSRPPILPGSACARRDR